MINEDAIKWLVNLKTDIGNPHYECLWHYAQAIDEICKLLEEQEPVKPIVEQYALPLTITSARFIKEYYCGICKEEITGNNVYCHKCGRKVKWDD